MPSSKSKAVQKKADNVPTHMSKEGFVRQAVQWFRANGILNDYEINNIILAAYMSSDIIRNVELFIDKKSKQIQVLVFIGRFSYLFKNREKILNKVIESLNPILQNQYDLNVEVKLYRKED